MAELTLDPSTDVMAARLGQKWRNRLRHGQAQGLVILQVLETYVAQEMAAGVPLDELAILGRWPAFQNSTLRALQAVKAIAEEKPDADSLITLDDLDD